MDVDFDQCKDCGFLSLDEENDIPVCTNKVVIQNYLMLKSLDDINDLPFNGVWISPTIINLINDVVYSSQDKYCKNYINEINYKLDKLEL